MRSARGLGEITPGGGRLVNESHPAQPEAASQAWSQRCQPAGADGLEPPTRAV